MNELALVGVGVILGLLSTAFWEGFLRPRFEVRSLAEVLLFEVGRNAQGLLVDRAYQHATPGLMPRPDSKETMAYQIALPRFGQFPRPLMGQLIHLYGLLIGLNGMAEDFSAHHEKLLALPPGERRHSEVENRLAELAARYEVTREHAISQVLMVQDELYRTAFPWWSPRRWKAGKAEKANRITGAQVQGRIADYNSALGRARERINKGLSGGTGAAR